MRRLGRLTLTALVALVAPILAAPRVHAQEGPTSQVKVKPGWFTGGGTSTAGVRWDARWAGASRRLGHVAPVPGAACVPVRPADEYTFELESTGAVALERRANADPIRLSARGGVWRSFFSPGCPSSDPDQPPTGSYYRGSGSITAFVRGEGIQGDREVDASAGVELLYTHSRRTGWWIVMPSLQLAVGAARPVTSALRDSLAQDQEWLSRGDLHLAWHVPLPASLRLDVNLRGWRSAGLSDTLKAAGLDAGSFAAIDLVRPLRWHLGTIPIREVFVRRVDGQVPQEWKQRRSWMVGVATGS